MNCPQLVCPTCNTPIDSHPASRCLDLWIAKEIFHQGEPSPQKRFDWWRADDRIGWIGDSPDYSEDGEWLRSWTRIEWPPDYSTSIYCAWQVLEEMWREDKEEGKKRWWPDILRIISSGEWVVDLILIGTDDSYEGCADTIEHAICIAALKASASQEAECVT